MGNSNGISPMQHSIVFSSERLLLYPSACCVGSGRQMSIIPIFDKNRSLSIKIDHKISCHYRFLSTFPCQNSILIENYRKIKSDQRELQGTLDNQNYCLSAQYWRAKTKRIYYSSYLPTKNNLKQIRQWARCPWKHFLNK